MRRTRQHRVAFRGEHAGSHPLAWAQAWVLDEIEGDGTSAPQNYNVRMHAPLEPGTTLSGALDAVRRVVERHEALRTHYPAAAADARRMQVVRAEGALTVVEFDCPADEVAAVTGQVSEQIALPLFGPDELPLRTALVCVDGTPRRVVLALHHVSADGLAAGIVCEEIRRLSLDPGAELPPVRQPREIAAHEQTPAQQRHAERADAYHRRQLEAARSARLAPGTPDASGGYPYRQWALNSRAVAAACHRLARHHGVSAGAVLLAAYAKVLDDRSPVGSRTLSLVSGNRDHPETRLTVTNLHQRTAVTVDTGHDDFGALCRQAGAACLRAYRYGRFDPVRQARAVDDERRRRVGDFALPYVVNLRIVGPGDLYPGAPNGARAGLDSHAGITREELRKLPDASEFFALHGTAPQKCDELKFDIWELSDTARMTLGTDTADLTGDDLRDVLQRFEMVLTTAACAEDVEYADE
ncbi:condensation domain-containing protein [Streptomyces sp. NPDC002577]